CLWHNALGVGGSVVHPLIGRYVYRAVIWNVLMKSRVEEWQLTFDTLSEIDNKLQLSLKDVDYLIECIEARSEEQSNFLNALALNGLLSAFEGYLHSVIPVLFDNHDLATIALERINELPECELSRLGLKGEGSISLAKVKRVYSKRTKNNPFREMELLSSIFGVSLTCVSEDDSNQLVKLRNLYTHRGGSEDFQNRVSLRVVTEARGLLDLQIAALPLAFLGALNELRGKYT
ncbi:hypothetical protein ACM6U7_004360, partial [Vibrio vulnificus]